MTREEAKSILENNAINATCTLGCLPPKAKETSSLNKQIEALNMAIKALQESKVCGWIPVSDRLPNMEEYLENDGRFILDDGNRRYQGLFDIYDKKFKFSKHLSGLSYELIEDNCVIAWQPLPEPYKAGEQE